ncbi:MAG: DUF1207 domain-containing protein [Bacteroidales bacterium]|jgi:hypothetical protein|nr:DUF1207 domain-containing protein [Bacteroidales bacterium]
MIRRCAIFIFLALSIVPGLAQQREKAVDYLPDEHYFDPLFLDPVECQSYGSLNAFWEGSTRQDLIYAPLALGFQLPVVQWDKGDYGFEIGFMATIFFQFEFVQPSSLFQVNLINTDIRAGLPFVFRMKRFSLRTAIVHQSSHFSEEYIFRNEIETFQENLNTYDAVDIHASWQFSKMRYYGGVEMAFNSPHDRGFWKFQAGTIFRTPVRIGSSFNFIVGADFQILEETRWSLNSMFGAGIEIAYRETRTFQVLAQYFTGNIPYTQYSHLKVQWLGATLIGHPF